ncbi:TRAP transporter large permease subunit [Breznakiella homolactica]|uniref:TRAP transporter large permease subunit n=1 Tax=Breznakiella homolactica TaxID=2798577 RepID=A0A7T7XLM5_9SPIR|nr:TRAP transporter large permease subunit [Breznakiella homolactica]QQO08561.1 TRAP transporter large permease subunit [Breznakiella homolactica]
MEKKQSILWKIEDIICWVSMGFLAAVPIAEVIARIFFKTGVPASSGIMIHLLLVVGLVSGMITTRQQQHLSIEFLQFISNDKVKHVLSIITNLIAAFIITIVAWCSASFVSIGLSPWRMIGFIPDQVFALVMPIGYAVMAFRFARLTPVRGAGRILPVLAVLGGTFFALPAISKLIWGFDAPDMVFAVNDGLSMLAYYIRIPVVIILIVSAMLGCPLFVVMGGLSLILIQSSWGEIDVVANQVYTALTQSSIIAIPLFTLVGFFLSESKAGERLVHTFRSLFSWLPGGMIIATVVICAFFTSFTGASGVTILALGGILYTILIEKSKYPEKFTIGLLTSVGGIGLLFPPSVPLLLVGATTMTNTMHLFAGGFIPGLILVAAMIIFGIVASRRNKIPVEKFQLKEALRGLKGAVWEILLPVLLIIGYFSGILSLVEIGAAAVIYIFIIEVFVNRDLKLRDLGRVFSKAVPIIGGVLSILALSQALSYYIVDTQAPENLARWMSSAIQSKVLFLLLLNLALLVVGCLMDIFSAILIVLPLIVPLGQAYGIDPVHLGIIFIINLEVGFLTPPVGMNLFLATYRFEKPFVEICRYVFPFLLIQLAVVFLVTYVPWLSTFLPRFF